MPTAVHIHQRGELRIYDGTPSTPQYLVLPWVQPDGRFPIGRPRPAFNLRLNRGVSDGYTHYTPGDDAPVASPLPVTFTLWIDEQMAIAVQNALGNPHHLNPWAVGATTFITAAGTGSVLKNGLGNDFPVPQVSHDPLHRRMHAEWLFFSSVVGALDHGWRHEEIYVGPDGLLIGDGDPVTMSVTYQIFGNIEPITAFTAGADITPFY